MIIGKNYVDTFKFSQAFIIVQECFAMRKHFPHNNSQHWNGPTS